MPKRICVIADDICIDRGSGPKVCHALIVLLGELGHQITVLHQSDLDVHFDQSNIESIWVKEEKSIDYFKSRLNRRSRKYFSADFSKRSEEKSGHSYTEDSLIASMHSALKAYNPKDYIFILTLSKGALFTAHKAVLKLPEWHGKWFSYFHDPFPFSWYPAPYTFNDIGTLIKQRLCFDFVTKASVLLFPSLKLMEHYQSLTVPIADKSAVVPHVYDTRDIDSLKVFDFETNGLNYVHAGALLKERAPFSLIAAFEKANELETKHHLHLVGPYQSHQEFIEKMNQQFDWLHVHGNVDYSTAQSMSKSADVNLIIEAIADSSPFLPGKFPVLLAMQKPILHIGPLNSESMRLLGSNYKLHAENGDKDKLIVLLEEIESVLKSEIIDLKTDHLIRHFSKEGILATWRSLIANVQIKNE